MLLESGRNSVQCPLNAELELEALCLSSTSWNFYTLFAINYNNISLVHKLSYIWEYYFGQNNNLYSYVFVTVG